MSTEPNGKSEGQDQKTDDKGNVETIDPNLTDLSEGDPNPAPTKDEPKDDPEDKSKDTPEDNPEDEPPLDTETWGSTGDDVGDSVLQLIQNSGMKPEEAKAILFDAVQAGDLTKIDRDALVEKVGKAKANLIMAGVENFTTRREAKNAEVTKDVHGTVGGKDNWEKVVSWAHKNVSAEDLQEFAGLINEGGKKAKFAASEMLSLYNSDDKNTTLGPTSRIEGDSAAPSSGRAISRREYADELDKAMRMNAKPAVIKEIQAARARGRKKGL